MNRETILCPADGGCGRPFKIAQFSFLDTSWERGKIRCPHCGFSLQGASDMVILSYAMTPPEEEKYMRDHGR